MTGDWEMPSGEDIADLPPEDMLPKAEKLPTIGSVTEAKRLLAEDKALALAMLERAGEDRLENEDSPAPWDPRGVPLGLQLFGMVGHLNGHKSQLFYYLKLQGKDMNTGHLW